MAGIVGNDLRDQLMTAFRERVCETMGVAPFLHQRQVWAAGDGLRLTGAESPDGVSVRVDEQTIVHAAYEARPEGRARFLADLGAFKIGKSYGAALWASGFAAVPGALINLVGLEYDVCAPEFSYLCEFLLSQRGMNLTATSVQNRPRDGKMWLDLPNGCRFEARSWERKDTLKGKEVDAYIYCEAYMLPGLECFTGFSQNLRARHGYAYFATTPDKPWVKQLHELGHGADPEWSCTCDVPAEANPFTFDAVAKRRDASLMTKEKYAIHYEGRMGDFVGRVFAFQRGQRTFSAGTHPFLFRGGTTRNSLVIPNGWTLVNGADTGTFYSALTVAFDPNGVAYVVDEFPNYRYVGGAPERDETLTIPQWVGQCTSRVQSLGGHAVFWADANSQFKGELRNYGMTLLAARTPVETRTEIAREYFAHDKIFLAPWVTVLAFELENAAWPEEASAAGKFARIKDRDHTLDSLEHVLARRPLGRHVMKQKQGSWAAGAGLKEHRTVSNIHLGRQ